MHTATECRGAGLAWREVGTGDTVVFLHGLGGTATAWSEQLAVLGGERRCVAWDMPGYGASHPYDPTGPAHVRLVIADAVVGLLDTVGVERPISSACRSAACTRSTRRFGVTPRRVHERLTLVDTSPAFGLDGVTTAESVDRRAPRSDRRRCAPVRDISPRRAGRDQWPRRSAAPDLAGPPASTR